MGLDVVRSEWAWVVLTVTASNQWFAVEGFSNNEAAAKCAQREAAKHPGQKFFVAETTHVARTKDVEFRPIYKT